jgi:ribonucleoside-diphosphate reductase alpha chain
MKNEFRTPLGKHIFHARYALNPDETWAQRAKMIVRDVCGRQESRTAITAHPLMSQSDQQALEELIRSFKFIPGGRYVYYAGRSAKFWSNCFCFKALEDTREEWGRLIKAHSDALMTGGGVGCDYSILRPHGEPLSRTGGVSSGPIPLMHSINEVGRNVRQGGARRSAIYGSLNWKHGDIERFLTEKDWANKYIPGTKFTYKEIKEADFDFPCPLDGMNISVNYDTSWLQTSYHPVFMKNIEMAMRNGEPGFSFNFHHQEKETGRNACCEVCTEDDSDVCNLGSINLANIANIEELRAVVNLASKFLICGSLRGELPNTNILRIREQNRRIGLGFMGIHEWLLQRNYKYEMNDELRSWLEVYRDESERSANEYADRFFISRPKAYRACAPTGTISLLAGTSSGIEPIYAVAYKRRWIQNDTRKYQLVIDQTAKDIIDHLGIEDPDKIETAITLAHDPNRRIEFQVEVQRYVDMAISSTLNLPAWGSETNNEDRIHEFATIVQNHAPNLRGLTFYPDGARGGQPITAIPYSEALGKEGIIYEDNSEQACKSGVCGI